MNKTIIININGIVFHIEENAYEVLVGYMNEVKQHFGNSTDSYEIVNDIENRLAEMFTEALKGAGKEVIVLEDVEAVIAQMGKPSDFEPEETVEQEEVYTERPSRKLFRDPEDRIIGGVCSGIGHYFNVEPRWIRVITLLFFLFAGSGLFMYLILWIVMPQAQTRADKMAMKGETPNLQNFKKNFEEEMQAVKANLDKAQQEVRPALHRLGAFIEQVFSHLGKFLKGTGKVLLKLIGAFIIFISLVILFALFVSLLAVLGVLSGSELPEFPFNIVNAEYRYALYISAFIVVLIPLVSLTLFAIRVLFNRPTLNRNIAFGLLVAWLVALSVGIVYASKTAAEFKQEARFYENQTLKSYPAYYLKLNTEKYLSAEDSVNYSIDKHSFKGRILINGDDHDMPDNFELSIEKADVPQAVITTEYGAHGKTFRSALESAKKISYRFSQQDSILSFDEFIHLAPAELWRGQRVKLTLKVPVNTRLIINSELNRYLNNYNLYDCLPEGDNDQVTGEWIMSADGLTCKNDSLYKQNRLQKDR